MTELLAPVMGLRQPRREREELRVSASNLLAPLSRLGGSSVDATAPQHGRATKLIALQLPAKKQVPSIDSGSLQYLGQRCGIAEVTLGGRVESGQQVVEQARHPLSPSLLDPPICELEIAPSRLHGSHTGSSSDCTSTVDTNS